MQVLGKVGDSITYLDTNSMRGKCQLSFSKFFVNYFIKKSDKLKVKSKNGFLSIRTNNCVISGKWIYEVLLNTNRLSQIGWCQLKTEFTTTDGVGDDTSSYAYDGYRNCTWHGDRKIYGELWNVGDVVGCGIDLEGGKIEYFLNGKSLGFAFLDVIKGENIAYFPAVSMTSDERITFNFGRSRFRYKYDNYDAYDLMASNQNGLSTTTSELLRLLSMSVFKKLNDPENSLYYKMTLSNRIFSFLRNESCNDENVLKYMIIPFLYSAQYINRDYVKIFMEYIYLPLDEKQKNIFNLNFYDNLFNLIEENSIGNENISTFNSLMDLVHCLFSFDFITQSWIESNNFIENLRCVFNQNMSKLSDIYKHLREKYPNQTETKSMKKIFREFHKEHYEKFLKKNEDVEKSYSKTITKFLCFFLFDKRTFFIRSQNKSFTLKACLGEFVNNGHKFYMMQDNMLNIFHDAQEDYSSFHRNFIVNLIKIHLEHFSKNSLESFNIEPWFSRNNPENAYHDEVGIGGTINHTTTEYIDKIPQDLLKKNEDFHNEINHRLIKVFSNILVPNFLDFRRKIDSVKIKF